MLLWYISLEFQDTNYFLNHWKLTHEWCVQRDQCLSNNRFKIEISIKILGNSVKFDVRKKKTKNQWALERCYSFAAVGLGKNAGALRWLIRQNLSLSKKCVLDEKRFSLVLKVWLGKVHQENEGCFQELPPDAYFIRVRLGWSIQRVRGSRGVTQSARFQGSTRFCEAAHGHWSRIWTTNL